MTSDEDQEPSRLIRAVADASAVVAGARLGGIDGIAIGALSSPYLEDFLNKAVGEFRSDARRRVKGMLTSASIAAECDPEKLAGLINASERTRLIAMNAMTSASSTAWPPKVHALGRALAGGLIASDEAQIYFADLALPAMADLERPHLSVLELIVNWVPSEGKDGKQDSPIKHEKFPIHNTRPHGFIAGDFTRSGWTIGRRKWSNYQIEEARPSLREVLTSLIATLQRHGLAQQFDNSPSMLAKYSKKLSNDSLSDSYTHSPHGYYSANNSTPIVPAISERDAVGLTSPTQWSPTEIGERILQYYYIAADSALP